MTITNYALDDDELLKYARQCTEARNRIEADAKDENEENKGNQDDAVVSRYEMKLRAAVQKLKQADVPVAEQDHAYNMHRPQLTARDLDLETKLDIVRLGATRKMTWNEIAVRFFVKERVVRDLMNKLSKKPSYFIK